MKTIVVPVNDSPNAANAARYAADMALAIGAEIQLVHVVHMPVTLSEFPMPDFVYEELKDLGFDLLRRLSEELDNRTRGKVPVWKAMEVGVVEDELVEHCKTYEPFLVVMGATERSIENLLGGNIVSKVQRRLHCPLLVVPENTVFHPIKSIVLACDLNDISVGMPVSVPFLQEIRDLFGAHFEVVNVTTPGETKQGEAVFEYNSWKASLQELIPELHFVPGGDVQEGVDHYIAEHKGDWLMVFPKKHKVVEFHRSQAKKLVRDCTVPVMSVHE